MSAEILAPALPTRFRLTRSHVFVLQRSGLLGDRHYELIDGDLFEKMPQDKPHATSVRRTTRAFDAIFGAEFVGSQAPIVLDDSNEPEPDVFVTRDTYDSYSDNPTAADIALVVEVSDSTLSLDRNAKMRLYAAASIPEYWIVDIEHRRLLVYLQPQPDGYGNMQTLTETDFIASLHSPQNTLGVIDLLP
ncbi:MAG: Uma2 family endonuclease [Armatimonas sp.]